MPPGSMTDTVQTGRLPAQAHPQTGADLRRGDDFRIQRCQWLAKNRPELISAEFALNEGGGGRTDGHGKLVVQTIQVGEKAAQNYKLETVNAGGHSSIPIRDNAIYELADALSKVREHEFPVKFSDTTRVFFAKSGLTRGDEMGHAMVALSKNPTDKAADAIVSKDRSYHSMLRTTCVATLLDGGHANNALPQRAAANVNCRIFPGETVEDTQAALVAVNRRSGRQGNVGSAGPARRCAAAAGSQNLRSGREAGRQIFPRRSAGSGHVHRRHRRNFSGGNWHSRLWRARAAGAIRMAMACTA